MLRAGRHFPQKISCLPLFAPIPHMLIQYVLVLTTIVLCVNAHQPAELFDAFEEFITGLLQPWSVAVPGNSSALSPDVVGRVNMMMTLNGIESNTEFLYGIPVKVMQGNTTQIIGYPTNATVESLSIQHSVVSASVIFSMYHAAMSLMTPLQVDLWLYFDKDLQISAYDLTIRNFPKAFSFLASVLSEQISREMSVGNSTNAVSSRMAADTCTAATEYCTGGNQQYDSYGSCFETLSRNVTMDNLDQSFCRYFVKDMVQARPSVHCSSLGPSGGDTCANGYYVNETNSGAEGLSDGTVIELMKFNMQVIYPTTVAFYSIPVFLYMPLLYVNGKGVDFLLVRFSKEYPNLSFANRRNVATYCLNAFWTTVAFILQSVASPMLGEHYTWDRIGEARMAAVIISGLYIYELIFRTSMRWPLLVHHFCTLFATIFIQIALQIALHPAIASAGLIWLFQATTEQSVFIGLVLYRLRFSIHVVAPVLRSAAVQSFICKIASAIYLLIWWGIKLSKFHLPVDVALSVMLVLLIQSSWLLKYKDHMRCDVLQGIFMDSLSAPCFR
ncbi:uncharacterized protein EV420DRAFT_314593 [Desarmillaria tabescens]|uniref:Uncharacterized protein n=1 Tax=Armillaria tabescens TaxID=1929756 RepID=A0AA39KDW5_ARMTA|nr:uncharacterized protein EV420DRAFT_314593 [Desarmillaria tabescens]KAK0459310.1 hypothetical protein EV420DRAFT_314593 [Desarmillaria tabescens]